MNVHAVPVVILIVSLLGRAKSVAMACCIVIFLQLIGSGTDLLEKSSPFIGSLGLALLLVQTLTPLANENTTAKGIIASLRSPLALVALVLAMVTTYFSGRGLAYLSLPDNSTAFVPILAGSLLSAVFLRGIPVGPYITAGILSTLEILLLRFCR